MPSLLLDIELIATNLTTLPDDLPQRWTAMSILYVEHSRLTALPTPLLRMKLFDVSVAHNSIESIEPLASLEASPFRLSLAGNPLRNLTTELRDGVSIAFLSLLRTAVDELPSWVSERVTDRVYLGGSPFCGAGDRVVAHATTLRVVDCTRPPATQRSVGRYPLDMIEQLRLLT
ncbi:hypothetical protein PINS_up017629 [Pythium insidiosum]|nr:hypothetical protein PINS_up017629 [Pythium insidiosum]